MNADSADREPVSGIADIQALAVAAVTALHESNLAAEAELIQTRVLSQLPAQLLEPVSDGAQTVWTFKPMVELLLYELRYVATAPDLSADEQRVRIRWTIDVAGF